MVVYKHSFTALPIHVLLCAFKFQPYAIIFKVKHRATRKSHVVCYCNSFGSIRLFCSTFIQKQWNNLISYRFPPALYFLPFKCKLFRIQLLLMSLMPTLAMPLSWCCYYHWNTCDTVFSIRSLSPGVFLFYFPLLTLFFSPWYKEMLMGGRNICIRAHCGTAGTLRALQNGAGAVLRVGWRCLSTGCKRGCS